MIALLWIYALFRPLESPLPIAYCIVADAFLLTILITVTA